MPAGMAGGRQQAQNRKVGITPSILLILNHPVLVLSHAFSLQSPISFLRSVKIVSHVQNDFPLAEHTLNPQVIQKLLHTDAFTHKAFTHKAFTHRSFYIQKLLHTDAFTQTLLHTDTFTHRRFYTQTLLTKILLHTGAFTHKSVYTQTLLHTKAFTHRSFYA